MGSETRAERVDWICLILPSFIFLIFFLIFYLIFDLCGRVCYICLWYKNMENGKYRSLMDVELNQENFESAIAVGTRMSNMLTLFGVSGKEMDEWCGKTYGIPQFSAVYYKCREAALQDYYEMLTKLGMRGNVTALNIMDNVIRGAMAEQQTVKIVFDGSGMRKETEQDKLNDDKQ